MTRRSSSIWCRRRSLQSDSRCVHWYCLIVVFLACGVGPFGINGRMVSWVKCQMSGVYQHRACVIEIFLQDVKMCPVTTTRAKQHTCVTVNLLLLLLLLLLFLSLLLLLLLLLCVLDAMRVRVCACVRVLLGWQHAIGHDVAATEPYHEISWQK